MDHTDLAIAAIPAGGSVEAELPVTLPQRGFCRVPPVHFSSCFPVNFFVRSCQLDLHQSLLVFPRPITTPMPRQYTPLAVSADYQATAPGGEGDLRSIEDYRAGDPPKSIHWKLSARHQELKTKLMNRQADEARIFDPEILDGNLEERLSRCAYLINRSFSYNQAVGLKISGRQIAPQSGNKQRLRLLKELALYE